MYFYFLFSDHCVASIPFVSYLSFFFSKKYFRSSLTNCYIVFFFYCLLSYLNYYFFLYKVYKIGSTRCDVNISFTYKSTYFNKFNSSIFLY